MKTTKQRLYLHGRPDTKAHFVLDEDDRPLCGKRIFLGEDSRVVRIWSNKYGNLEFTLSHDDLPYELRSSNICRVCMKKMHEHSSLFISLLKNATLPENIALNLRLEIPLGMDNQVQKESVDGQGS